MRTLSALLLLIVPAIVGATVAAPTGNVVLPSDVAVTLDAVPSTGLAPGQPITLTITVRNNGPATLTNFAVQSANIYPDQIDITNIQTDCQDVAISVTDASPTFWYNFTWTPTDTSALTPGNWPLSVGESRSCHATIRLLNPSILTVPFDFHLLGYWSDSNASNNVGSVTLALAVPMVPALSPAMLLFLALLIAASSILRNVAATIRRIFPDGNDR